MAVDSTSVPCSILFTIPNFITAGSGRAMVNIIERLDRRKFSPAVCVRRKGGALDRYVEELGVPLLEQPFTVSARPYATLLMRARRAARGFQPHQFDLWHSFHYSDDFTEPIIARMAGATGWVYTKKNMNWHRRSWYMRTLLATRVAAQNADMVSEFFAGRWWRKRVRLIPRGVDTTRFCPNGRHAGGLRDRLGVHADQVLFGCVAHLVAVKGHPTLLEALAQVPGAHLVVAGQPLDKEYVASLHDKVRDLEIEDRVHFVGPVGDVAQLLSELDAFVLPTWARWRMEGCPVSLLEAMSAALPCVATDIPGSRDVIEHARSGWLVAPEDVNELAGALEHLARDASLREQLGKAGRSRVLERFTIEREVAAHEALYEELGRTKGIACG